MCSAPLCSHHELTHQPNPLPARDCSEMLLPQAWIGIDNAAPVNLSLWFLSSYWGGWVTGSFARQHERDFWWFSGRLRAPWLTWVERSTHEHECLHCLGLALTLFGVPDHGQTQQVPQDSWLFVAFPPLPRSCSRKISLSPSIHGNVLLTATALERPRSKPWFFKLL